MASDVTQSQQSERRRADLYMRMYKYAAEDFAANSDMRTYSMDMSIWMQSIENKLTKLFNILANHTHKIAPHTHNIAPHFHVAPSSGGPTSPVPLVTLINVPIEGLLPTQKPTIKWTRGSIPSLKNTTGTIPNLTGNRTMNGIATGEAEDKSPHLRRQLIIPVLLTPSIPPAIIGLTS